MYAIKITMKDDRAEVTAYYRNKGVNLAKATHPKDFCCFTPNAPTTYVDPDNAERKRVLVVETCKRIKQRLRAEGIEREFNVEVIPFH